MSSFKTLLCIGILLLFTAVKAQVRISTNVTQGLMEDWPDYNPENMVFENINAKCCLGFWNLEIIGRYEAESVNIDCHFDINQPTQVVGPTIDGGTRHYNLADYGVSLHLYQSWFRLDGTYLNRKTNERVSFSTKVWVSEFGKSVTGGILFSAGSRGNLTGDEYIRSLDIQVKVIPLHKVITGFKAMDDILGKELKAGRLKNQFLAKVTDARAAYQFGYVDQAIDYYEQALQIKDDDEVRAELQKLLDQRQAKKWLEEARFAEADNNPEDAKRLYEKAAVVLNDPAIQNDIDRTDAAIVKKKEEEARLAEMQASEGENLNVTEDLNASEESMGEAVGSNTQNAVVVENEEENRFLKQQQAEQERKAQERAIWEKEEAARRVQVDNYNNELVQQGNKIYQQSLDIDREMKKSLSNISSETYADPRAMINAGMSMLSSANGNMGQAISGAALSGVGIASGILDGLAKNKAKKEAAAERRRQIAAAEARKKEIRESIRKARIAVFNGYPQGELPISTTKSAGNNLYYFVYAYQPNSLLDDQPVVTLTKPFAIGKYPDGTWPMKTKISNQIQGITPLEEVMVGPMYSLAEANNIHNTFLNYLSGTAMGTSFLEFEGINPQPESPEGISSGPAIDFWGKPMDSSSNSEPNNSNNPSQNIELDFWGNPIKKDNH